VGRRKLHLATRGCEGFSVASYVKAQRVLGDGKQMIAGTQKAERGNAPNLSVFLCGKPCRIERLCGNPGLRVFRQLNHGAYIAFPFHYSSDPGRLPA